MVCIRGDVKRRNLASNKLMIVKLFATFKTLMFCGCKQFDPYQVFLYLITYMKKFLHFDWLRVVQFFFENSAEKS